jgi:hypothetical protein
MYLTERLNGVSGSFFKRMPVGHIDAQGFDVSGLMSRIKLRERLFDVFIVPIGKDDLHPRIGPTPAAQG